MGRWVSRQDEILESVQFDPLAGPIGKRLIMRPRFPRHAAAGRATIMAALINVIGNDIEWGGTAKTPSLHRHPRRRPRIHAEPFSRSERRGSAPPIMTRERPARAACTGLPP